MKSYGPRPLIRITTEQTIVSRQIDIINEAFQFNEIILVCGEEAERVMNNTPNTIIKVHNENFESTNVVRSLALGLRACTTNRVLIMYGDLLFNYETLVNARFEESCLFIDEANLFSKDSAGCTFNESNIAEHMLYELPHKWVQIAFFTHKELDLLRSVVWNREKDKLFGFEAINEVINRNGILKYQSPKNMRIIDIDSSKDLQNIKSVL
jgi:choline kinase